MHNIIMQVVDHQEKIIKFYNMPKEKKMILNMNKWKTWY